MFYTWSEVVQCKQRCFFMLCMAQVTLAVEAVGTISGSIDALVSIVVGRINAGQEGSNRSQPSYIRGISGISVWVSNSFWDIKIRQDLRSTHHISTDNRWNCKWSNGVENIAKIANAILVVVSVVTLVVVSVVILTVVSVVISVVVSVVMAVVASMVMAVVSVVVLVVSF